MKEIQADERFESFHAKMKAIKYKKYNQEPYSMKSCVKNSQEKQIIAVSGNIHAVISCRQLLLFNGI